MRKSPFLIFAAVMALLIGGVISYIQSEAFATLAKRVLARYVPTDLGIEGDFSEFKVKLFPPGLSVVRPHVRVMDRNLAGLPPGSTLVAERVDFAFRPLQMVTGDIRVHEVTIAGGDALIKLGDLLSAKRKKKGAKSEFRWDSLFQVHADAISLIDTRIRIESAGPDLEAELVAKHARIGQWSGVGGLGYELELELSGISRLGGALLKGAPLPPTIERVAATAHVNVAGLQVERLEIAVPGARANVSGSVQGDLFDAKAPLKFAAQTSFDVELARLQTAIAPSLAKFAVAGDVGFNGKLSGSLARLAETLRAEGRLLGKELRFAGWGADALKAELAWQASPRGGELAVSSLELASPEREKSGGFQSGSGGRVKIGAFKADIGALLAPAAGAPPAVIRVPVTLERAHIHWLGAGALKQIYPLDLRATGPVDATVRLGAGGKSWAVDAKVGLDVENFSLDNQKLGLKKPLHRILKIAKVRLDSDVALDRTGVTLSDLTVGTGTETEFEGSGKVDFKTGFDLYFSGSADLKEVGQIAENDIRGRGDLECHVHGTPSKPILDFDPEISDASYLKLHLGELRGRITWDDDPNKLIFTRVQSKRGRTSVTADGVIDLDKDKDTIDLSVRIPMGEIQDLIPVFDEMTHDLWWFPRGLIGPVHGDVKISGGITMERLIVAARVNGTDWQHWGERFGTVQLQGGYDRGKYHLSDFSAIKRNGRVLGRISLDPNKVIDWGVHTEGFTIADVDHLAQLDVPMRGRLSIESAGKGKEGAIQSSTLARVDDFAVRGLPLPPSDLAIRTEGGKAEVRGVALGGQGSIEALYDFTLGGRSSIKGELKHLDFSPAVLMLNPKLIQDRALAGAISGSANLTFASGRIERATGSLELSEYRLAKTGSGFELAQPVSLKISDGSFDLRSLALRGTQSDARLSLRGSHSELSGSVTGSIDASIVEFITPVVADAEGETELDLILGGRLKEPTIFGKASFEGVSVRLHALESPFENASGTLQLRQNALSVQNVQADLAGGRVSADGTVLLFADRYPKVDLRGEVVGTKLKVPPFQFVKLHGGLEVHGDRLPYKVDGDIAVESALSTEKVFGQKKGDGLKALQYTPPPTASSSADYPKFKLDIKVAAEGGVLIKNDLFDAEAKADLTVVNTIEAPRLLGTASLIAGKIIFKDRSFQIQSANAVFDNPAVIAPRFTLTAGSEVSGTKIQMYASGKLPNDWKIELSSNPVMPESEILNLLALGMTSTEARRLSASDRAVLEQGEAASLLLNSLDFNRDMQAKTGIEIGIDEYTAPQTQGNSVFKPQTSAESVSQPKIVIKRKIGNRFELSYGQTVGNSTTSNAQQVTGEFRLTPGVSALGVFDNYNTIDAQTRQSYGGDLKFQWRFK